MSICQASEMTKAQLKQMRKGDKHGQESKRGCNKRKAQKKNKHKSHQGKTKEKFKCKRCGNENAPRSCPAFHKQCKMCKKKMNYFGCVMQRRCMQSPSDASDEEKDLCWCSSFRLNRQD